MAARRHASDRCGRRCARCSRRDWRTGGNAASPEGSANHLAADTRIHAIEATLVQLDRDPTFTFGLQLGAAEIAGGKTASYEQILGAEMNATKAAIMARDPALPRPAGTDIGDALGMIYSPEQFVQLARDTVADRHRLATLALPWNGESRPVISAKGEIDQDLARAARKNAIDATSFTHDQHDTVALLKSYMDRVNTLDYMTRFTGKEVGAAAHQVEEALKLVKQLTSADPITKEIAAQIDTTLRGNVAQARTASEAQFYHRAAASKDRVVINADIKDLGLDVIDGNAQAMDKIAAGGDVDAVSRGASDEIVKMKRKIMEKLNAFYQDKLLPAARAQIVEQHREDLLPLLEHEQQPLLLLGGDEITVSLPRAFEELGLVPMVAEHLQADARARVAVTHTGKTTDGARGHEEAMKASETPHDVLKTYEQLARDLGDVADRLPEGEGDEANGLVRFLEHVYMSADGDGRTSTKGPDGKTVSDSDFVSRKTRAEQLLQKGRSHGP